MSLNGMMRTGVSGMNAQANRLSTVAENIANSDTTGYKRASTEFSSLILPSSAGSYNSGGVTTDVRYSVYKQGEMEFTSSRSDLAIDGNGFFIVQDPNGNPFLTRAGSFVPNGNGELVNAAGFTLLGYDYTSGAPATVVNGFDGLVPVNIGQSALSATPSTSGNFYANLPAGADIVAAGSLPSDNAATSTHSAKSSLVAFDNVGNQILLDFYYTKTADDTWEVAVYDRADAAPGTSFPYANGPLQTETLTFDTTTGDLTNGSAQDITFTVPGGQPVQIDLSRMTALGYPFDVANAAVDGSAPSKLVRVEFGPDGTVFGQYENGNLEPMYRLALATVQSPDKLSPLAGNVYSQGVDSGVVTTGFAQSGTFGAIVSGALEGSNVDIAEELTSMIEAQRSYTANSKVFQTGSDLMEVLVNLKR